MPYKQWMGKFGPTTEFSDPQVIYTVQHLPRLS
jgi:hypothetical protein